MCGRLTGALALGIALLALLAGMASAAKPTVVRAGNLVLKLNGGVAPKALPRARMAPIRLNMSGGISTADGGQPPVAKVAQIDFDRHGAIDARGLATCRRGKLEAQPTGPARAACRNSIVGSGTTTVRVQFPDQRPFTAKGPLVLFNGGVQGGTTLLLIHAYVAVPAPTAIVTPVRITKIRKGRFGTRATARIPTIAGGSGALTNFKLSIQRQFNRGGMRQSYLLARCADRRFFAHGTISFNDGTRLSGNVVRPCRQRG